MTEEQLDDRLREALRTIVDRYGKDGQPITIRNADALVLEELERQGFLSMLDYDLSGNAIAMPAYKAISYFESATSKKSRSANKSQVVYQTFFESYKRVKDIGSGGAGNVFEVEASDGQRFALKVLSPDAARNNAKVKRFLQEARYEQSGKCDAIISVVDTGVLIDGDVRRPFYVMPLMDGNLAGLMKPSSGYRPADLTNMLLALMASLAPFYRSGNYHRDIKPQNLLFDKNSMRLVLADLGIAHIEEEYPGATVETATSERLANFRYAAPEQRVKRPHCDERADEYAFGLILNELFTGDVPQGTGYKRIADVDKSYAFLDPIVEKMISQRAEDRYANIEAVLLDIEASSAEAKAAEEATRICDYDPPKGELGLSILSKHWDDGILTFVMSGHLEGDWLRILQSYGNTSFTTDGFYLDPNRFQYSEDSIIVPKVGYDKSRVRDAVSYVEKAVSWANENYARYVESLRRRVHDELVNRRRAELEHAKKNAEASRAINDMLANL